MRSKTHPLLVAVAVALATVGAAGCGEAIDINRVQPNYTDKAQFEGEWYYRATVVDKQFHTDSIFIGYQGELERVRWEITENQLIAHRSYERVPGSDPANPGDENVVASFAIQSHFDIKRDYNPLNGVETNVIVENTQDRPWWERQYVRVDWSRNLVASYSFGSGLWTGPQTITRNANNDPAYPWKVRIEPDYMETTVDEIANPDPYICYFLDPLSPCNGANIKTKLAFKKVDQANDYVAFDYPDFVPVAPGELHRADNDEPIGTAANGDVTRICVAAEVGTDGTGIFLVNETGGSTRMCNLDPIGGDDLTDCTEILGRCENMTALQIAGGPEDVSTDCDVTQHDPDDCFTITTPMFSRFGFFRTDRFVLDRENHFTLGGRERLINRWNIWKKSRNDAGDIIPESARELRPIVYYTNVHFPTDPELRSALTDMAADWDTAFRSTVAAVRHTPIADVTTAMFEIRENDCNIPHVNSYADENDLTGALRDNGITEVAYGNLENACAVLEQASLVKHAQDPTVPVFTWQQLGDLRYSFVNWTPKAELAGPLGYGPSSADPITGEIIGANANVYGTSVDTYSNWGADVVQLINGELTEGDIINGTQVREHIEGVRNRWREKVSPDQVTGFLNLVEQRTAGMSDQQYLLKKPITAINANLEKLKESGLEDEFLINDDMLRMFGNDPQAQREGRVTDAMMNAARPSTWARTTIPEEALVSLQNGSYDPNAQAAKPMDPTAIGAAARLDEISDYLGRKNFCFMAQQVEPAVADLAAALADEGLSREQLVSRIRAQVFRGVMAHELGHTFGLRHNFEGSADPMNFFPQYWNVTDLDADQAHLLAKSPRAREQMYSSIMDYHQRFNSDFAGIGTYDKAAIKFGYANLVEVFDETPEAPFVARGWIDSMFLLDPSEIPYVLGGPLANDKIDAEYNRTLERVESGDEFAVMDIKGGAGITPHPENIYRRRNVPMKDWLRNETLAAYARGYGYESTDLLQSVGLLDDDGQPYRIAVPYTFCSDAYAFGGNLTCNRWDQGVTSREIVKNAGEMYEFYYPFDAFRRERALNPFSSWTNGYINRLYQRTYQPMLNAFRYFYYYRRSSARLFPAIRDWGEASLVGLNFFERVLQTPTVGKYCKDGGTYVPEAEAASCADSVNIDLGVGRIFNSTWDNEYDFRPVNVGHYWDKALAIQAMTDSDAFFFRDFSSYTNRGAFSIGYYRVFQPEMLKLFGGLFRGDTSAYQGRVVVDGAGKASINYQPFIQTDVYGEPLPVDPDALAGDPIEPSNSYQLRYWAAVFGMVNLSSTLDQTMDFAQRARITIAGSQSDPVRDPSVITPENDIVFTDPVTHVQYHAVALDGADASIGFQALSDAKSVAEGEWATARADLDAAEAGNDADVLADAQRAFNRANAALNDKVQLIDFFVYLGDIFEYSGG